MYLHKTKNGNYTPPCCYFSGELEVVEILRVGFCCKASMSIMVWRIGILISNKMVALSVQIFVGIILYGLFLLLMKDEFVMESIRRVKLKI